MMLYIRTKFHENILDGIKVIQWTQFSCEKVQLGAILKKCRWSFDSLFSAHRICTKFHENILNGISYGADMKS